MDPGDPDSAYDLFMRGSRLLAQRHPGAAAVLLERCLALEPDKASILEALGRAYYNQGAFPFAAERFPAMVDAQPACPLRAFWAGARQPPDGGPSRGAGLRMAVF